MPFYWTFLSFLHYTARMPLFSTISPASLLSNTESSHKIQQKTFVIGSQWIFDTASQFSLKTLIKHLFKTWFTWLVFISLYFLLQNFADKSIYQDLTSDLSLKFLTELLLSSSAKISFCNSFLISGIVFPFTVKISNVLCWPIFRVRPPLVVVLFIVIL